MDLINSAKSDLINFDFIACIHKVHLVLLNLNNHVHNSEFWKKTDQKDEIKQLACFTYELIRIITILYKPILPKMMSNINKYIGIDESKMNLENAIFRFSDKNVNSNNLKHAYFNINTSYKNLIFVIKKK